MDNNNDNNKSVNNEGADEDALLEGSTASIDVDDILNSSPNAGRSRPTSSAAAAVASPAELEIEPMGEEVEEMLREMYQEGEEEEQMDTSGPSSSNSSRRDSLAPHQEKLFAKLDRRQLKEDKETAEYVSADKPNYVERLINGKMVRVRMVRNRPLQTEMARMNALRRAEVGSGGRRSGRQPELETEGEQSWQGASRRMGVEIQDDSKLTYRQRYAKNVAVAGKRKRKNRCGSSGMTRRTSQGQRQDVVNPAAAPSAALETPPASP